MNLSKEEQHNLAQLLMSSEESSIILGLEMLQQQRELLDAFVVPLTILSNFSTNEVVKKALNHFLKETSVDVELYRYNFQVFRTIRSYNKELRETILKEWNVFAESQELYLPYMQMNPSYMDKIGYVGYRMYQRFAIYDEAKTVLELCLKYVPDNGERCFDLAYLISERINNAGIWLDQKQKVITYYAHSAKCGFSPAMSYHNVGLAYKRLFKNKTKAKRFYEKALELNPNYDDALNNLANIIVDDDWKSAEKMYKKALKIKAHRPSTMNNLAFHYWKDDQDFEQAENYIKKSLKIERSYYNLVTAARIYWEAGKKDIPQVKQMIRNALKKKANYIYAYILLAEIQIKTNKRLDLARKYLDKAIEIDPTEEEVLALEKQLKKS